MSKQINCIPCKFSIDNLPLHRFAADLSLSESEKEDWNKKIVSLYQTCIDVCHPEAFLCFPGKNIFSENSVRCAFLSVSLGDLTPLFEQLQDCSEEYLLNLIATRLLFVITEQCETQLKELCREKNLKLLRRMEAPDDFAPELLPDILSFFGDTSHITLNQNYVLHPLYSMVFAYPLDEVICNNDTSNQNHTSKLEHHCASCPRKECPLRHYEMTVLPKQTVISVRPDETIATALENSQIEFHQDCGGRGTCRKCAIQVTAGNLPITEADRFAFSILQLAQGWRLACQAHLEGDITICLNRSMENNFETVVKFQAEKFHNRTLPQSFCHDLDYGIAIDIGTTTLAAALVHLKDGHVIHTASSINRQRIYGADVLSRIQAANEKRTKAIAMQRLIRTDLLNLIQQLMSALPSDAQLLRIVMAGNTTMFHLLMGYDCSGLGVYPFHPHSLKTVQTSFSELLQDNRLQCPVILLPGISAFVGADIVSDLIACQFDTQENPSLLIDLGTNGEMAIGNRHRLLVSSTAAGPAFEGGSIKYGTGSVCGAISHVNWKDNCLQYQTIQNQTPPCGICGTGVLEITSLLLEQGLMDQTGCLHPSIFEKGLPVAENAYGETIFFTQQDVREVQLAKSAIRSGIELLIQEYGLSYEEIDKVYLAGGFGAYLNIGKAVSIGMLPSALASKIISVGNSSLQGAILCCQNPKLLQNMNTLITVSNEKSLASLPDFQTSFMHYMTF
ncbi:MAG: ASKHA domain-containing protein [Lachnospiraceae bacterium]